MDRCHMSWISNSVKEDRVGRSREGAALGRVLRAGPCALLADTHFLPLVLDVLWLAR